MIKRILSLFTLSILSLSSVSNLTAFTTNNLEPKIKNHIKNNNFNSLNKNNLKTPIEFKNLPKNTIKMINICSNNFHIKDSDAFVEDINKNVYLYSSKLNLYSFAFKVDGIIKKTFDGDNYNAYLQTQDLNNTYIYSIGNNFGNLYASINRIDLNNINFTSFISNKKEYYFLSFQDKENGLNWYSSSQNSIDVKTIIYNHQIYTTQANIVYYDWETYKIINNHYQNIYYTSNGIYIYDLNLENNIYKITRINYDINTIFYNNELIFYGVDYNTKQEYFKTITIDNYINFINSFIAENGYTLNFIDDLFKNKNIKTLNLNMFSDMYSKINIFKQDLKSDFRINGSSNPKTLIFDLTYENIKQQEVSKVITFDGSVFKVWKNLTGTFIKNNWYWPTIISAYSFNYSNNDWVFIETYPMGTLLNKQIYISKIYDFTNKNQFIYMFNNPLFVADTRSYNLKYLNYDLNKNTGMLAFEKNAPGYSYMVFHFNIKENDKGYYINNLETKTSNNIIFQKSYAINNFYYINNNLYFIANNNYIYFWNFTKDGVIQLSKIDNNNFCFINHFIYFEKNNIYEYQDLDNSISYSSSIIANIKQYLINDIESKIKKTNFIIKEDKNLLNNDFITETSNKKIKKDILNKIIKDNNLNPDYIKYFSLCYPMKNLKQNLFTSNQSNLILKITDGNITDYKNINVNLSTIKHKEAWYKNKIYLSITILSGVGLLIIINIILYFIIKNKKQKY